jgi:Ser/Thr protein kinase RdoA (MazF antagonist)
MPNAPVELAQLLSTFTDDEFANLKEAAAALAATHKFAELTAAELEELFEGLAHEGRRIRDDFRGLLISVHAVRNEQRRRRLHVVPA